MLSSARFQRKILICLELPSFAMKCPNNFETCFSLPQTAEKLLKGLRAPEYIAYCSYDEVYFSNL